MDPILFIVQRYLTGLMVILCFIGVLTSLVTCFIFTRPKHRQNACSIFCAATSASNILILTQAIVGTILEMSLDEDPLNYNLIYCKTRLYIRHALVMSNRTFTIVSCAACFALTSKRTRLRQIIQQTNLCRRFVLFTFIFWLCFCCHSVFFTDLENHQCKMIGNYALIFAIYLFILAGTISPFLMILFSCLVVKNLRELLSRVRPTANSSHLKKRDLQFVRMLLFHIIIYLATTVLYPIDLLYSSLKSTKNDEQISDQRRSIESFVTFLTNNFLFYLNNIAPFFTYYLTSSSFRSEVHSFRLRRGVRQIFTFSSQIIERFDLQHR